MGIKQLSKVIAENCPAAVKNSDIKTYSGCKIAIDASMSIYQFLIAVRQEGNTLTNSDGETTSHLMGMFYRTLRMVDNGIKPFYVFDGKPPDHKSGELLKRTQRRDDAKEKQKIAEDLGDVETQEKMSKRLVKPTDTQINQCKELLGLMGIPVVQAPCEAEAQCSVLVKSGKAFGVGTEDMDALTFGGSILLRKLTCSESKKVPVQEYHLKTILSDMDLTIDQFIDLCILLGCDYCDTIRGIGPKKAVEYIKKHKDIETVIENLDKDKYSIPDDWNFEIARKLFKEPIIEDVDNIELHWKQPDIEGIVDLMCNKNGFNEDRIRNATNRLVKARNGATQHRIDLYFTKIDGPKKRPSVVVKEKPAKKTKIGIGKLQKKK